MTRAIGDLMLARLEQTDQLFWQPVGQIRQERKDCYAILETTQKAGDAHPSWCR